MSKNFNEITRENVLEAIRFYNENHPEHTKPRNTFLVFEDEYYPAKFIRKLSYELKYKEKLTSEDLSGGLETVRFFERLGFSVDYSGKSSKGKQDLKIGLYRQFERYRNPDSFRKFENLVRNAHLDLVVFPELAYFPFVEDFNNTDTLDQSERESLVKKVLELSKDLNAAVVVNAGEANGSIVSIYANAFAKRDETVSQIHFKHTHTGKSFFEIEEEEICSDQYGSINLKGWKIGLSICFDMLLPLFDRIKKRRGAEIVINSTGGNVVKNKWLTNLRTRAIENQIYYLTTMGLGPDKRNIALGITPDGDQLTDYEIGDDETGPLTIVEVRQKNNSTVKIEDSTNPTRNRVPDFTLKLNDLPKLKTSFKRINDKVFVQEEADRNIVYIWFKDKEVFVPELILEQMLSPDLDAYPNKKFILVNQWNRLNTNLDISQLLPVLKNRATENYCAVIFLSPEDLLCFQSTMTKSAQNVLIEDGTVKLDLKRTSGPSTAWKSLDTARKGAFIHYKNLLEELVG